MMSSVFKIHWTSKFIGLLFTGTLVTALTLYFSSYVARQKQDITGQAAVADTQVRLYSFPTAIESTVGNPFNIYLRALIPEGIKASSIGLSVLFDSNLLKLTQITPEEGANSLPLL